MHPSDTVQSSTIVLHGVMDGLGVWLGVMDELGVLLGVIDELGVFDGVIDALGDTDGVMDELGVLEGVIVSDGVPTGVIELEGVMEGVSDPLAVTLGVPLADAVLLAVMEGVEVPEDDSVLGGVTEDDGVLDDVGSEVPDTEGVTLPAAVFEAVNDPVPVLDGVAHANCAKSLGGSTTPRNMVLVPAVPTTVNVPAPVSTRNSAVVLVTYAIQDRPSARHAREPVSACPVMDTVAVDGHGRVDVLVYCTSFDGVPVLSTSHNVMGDAQHGGPAIFAVIAPDE